MKDLARFPELRFLDRFARVPLIAYALGCHAVAGVPREEQPAWAVAGHSRASHSGESAGEFLTRPDR